MSDSKPTTAECVAWLDTAIDNKPIVYREGILHAFRAQLLAAQGLAEALDKIVEWDEAGDEPDFSVVYNAQEAWKVAGGE